MGKARRLSIAGFLLLSLMPVQMAVANSPQPSPSSCCKKRTAADQAARNFARNSVPFRKAAEKAWRATHNGDAPFEAGFSIGSDGQPGKVQLSIFETVNAATHLEIASTPFAIGTLHVHNRYGVSTPSPGDIKSARLLREVVYVESRTGLYMVSPDGTVRHLFDRLDWFNKKCSN